MRAEFPVSSLELLGNFVYLGAFVCKEKLAVHPKKNEHPLTNQAHLTLDFDSSSAKKIAMDPLKGAALVICAISLHKTASTKRTL